jgi:hypothetical protein
MKKAVYKDPKILGGNDYSRIPVDKRQDHYGDAVERLIRRKYSVSAELAILRQRDDKPEEFAVYNAYAEECKAEAKAILGLN